ncbi:MAG: hypothetical protein QOH38_744 [Thermoleophilaceae bacterium]|nr:hypothetical protein [Thermoleophilaceae bacterium]
MSLTRGTGPFAPRRAGVFNFELGRTKGLIYFEDSPRRIRAILAGETIVDSRRSKLLHEQGKLPIHYFPEDEVRTELLEPTDHHTHCPWKGDASYWSVRVGDTVAENAVWGYPEPLPDAPPLAGHLAFYWDSMDEWLEEDEPLIGHARDPYHRVDVVDTSRAIRIEIDGDVVAETTRARALFETGLPTRWYIPPDDVRADLLTTSDTHSVCAYKGVASYRTVGDEADVAWFYPEPRRDAERIRDHLCFFNERVDVYVDGELQERPESPWSHPTGR